MKKKMEDMEFVSGVETIIQKLNSQSMLILKLSSKLFVPPWIYQFIVIIKHFPCKQRAFKKSTFLDHHSWVAIFGSCLSNPKEEKKNKGVKTLEKNDECVCFSSNSFKK